MTEQDKASESIRADIRSNNTGQIGVGKNIAQSQSIGTAGPALTETELADLWQILAGFKDQVATGAPPEKREAALERVDELEEAITADDPDLTTMEYVRNWFGKNLPALAGAVTSVLVHPLVGKAIEVAGGAAANEFRRRF